MAASLGTVLAGAEKVAGRSKWLGSGLGETKFFFCFKGGMGAGELVPAISALGIVRSRGSGPRAEVKARRQALGRPFPPSLLHPWLVSSLGSLSAGSGNETGRVGAREGSADRTGTKLPRAGGGRVGGRSSFRSLAASVYPVCSSGLSRDRRASLGPGSAQSPVETGGAEQRRRGRVRVRGEAPGGGGGGASGAGPRAARAAGCGAAWREARRASAP